MDDTYNIHENIEDDKCSYENINIVEIDDKMKDIQQYKNSDVIST